MIRETSLEIDATHRRWRVEFESRYARKNKLRYIDQLLNELENLNLAEAGAMPRDLRGRVHRVLSDHGHRVVRGASPRLTIADSMEALYEVQDTLMLPGMEDDEA